MGFLFEALMDDVIQFGQYKGQRFIDLPIKYLEWLVDQSKYGVRDQAIQSLRKKKGTCEYGSLTDNAIFTYHRFK